MPTRVADKPGFSSCLQLLTDLGDLPVWSLIVTVFGDLAQNPGDGISGPLLSAILDPVGVKPEASRVATHRLRKEGWIVSERSGRNRLHHLTEFGRTQSAAASPRIYSAPVFDPVWHILLMAPGVRATADHVAVMPRVFLGNGPAPHRADALVIEGGVTNVPAWMKAQIASASLREKYAVLETVLSQISLSVPPALTPLETAILRTLIVHHWRRLVLRHPALPDGFYSSDWRGTACRKTAFSLLDALPRPSLQVLESSI